MWTGLGSNSWICRKSWWLELLALRLNSSYWNIKPAASTFNQCLILAPFSQFPHRQVCKWNAAYTCNWINMKPSSNKKLPLVRLQKRALARTAKIATRTLALKYSSFHSKCYFLTYLKLRLLCHIQRRLTRIYPNPSLTPWTPFTIFSF